MQQDGQDSNSTGRIRARWRWMKSRPRWAYAVAAVVVILIGAIAWQKLQSSADNNRTGRRFARSGPMPVSVATAAKKTFDIYVSGLGNVTPLEVATVRSRVDGELVKVAFKEGDLVKEGAQLAQIDPRPFEVQVMQAQGQLARDQALLKNAEVDLERYRTLLAQDSTSKQQVDTQAALVEQYHAALQSDQAQVANAQLQLTYSKVTAPISGRLGLRQVDRGNIVHAGDTNGLVVITKIDPISVLFTVPEDQLAALIHQRRANEISPVEAWDRAAKVKLATGTLGTFDNQVDAATGTVKLRANFDNRDGVLFPNQFVNVKLLVDRLVDTTVVPVAAIQRGQQGTFVYVVNEDDTVTARPVELGQTQAAEVAVNKGIEPGAVVVIDGGDKLRDGAKVEPIVAEDATPKSEAPRQKRPPGDWQKNGADPNRRRKRDPQSTPSAS